MPRRRLHDDDVRYVTLSTGRKERKCEDESLLDPDELAFKKSYACILKASDESYRYISDAVRVKSSIVKKWFEDEAMQKHVEQVRKDLIDNAIEVGKLKSVKMMELLSDVAEKARAARDWGDAIRAAEAVLDRVGLSKVNKSESKVTRPPAEGEGLDKFFDRFEALPLDTQRRVADLMGEVDELTKEARGSE